MRPQGSQARELLFLSERLREIADAMCKLSPLEYDFEKRRGELIRQLDRIRTRMRQLDGFATSH